MDETVTTAKSALWAGRIQNFYSSGLSRKAWCQTNNVPLSTLSYWIRKLAKGSGEQQQDHEPVFARMPSEHEIRSKETNALAPVIIYFPGNIRLEVNAGCPAEMISSLIHIIKSYA